MNIVFQHASKRRGYILLKGQEMIIAHGFKPSEVITANPGHSLLLSCILDRKVPENSCGLGFKDLIGHWYRVREKRVKINGDDRGRSFMISSKHRTTQCHYFNRGKLLRTGGEPNGEVFNEKRGLVFVNAHKRVQLRTLLVYQRFDIEFDGAPFQLRQQLERQRGGVMEVGGAKIEAWEDVLYATNRPVP